MSKLYKELNTEIVLNAHKQEKLCNEVKRTGFLIDRGQKIELRAGDMLTLYVSMGGFEKWGSESDGVKKFILWFY